mmetsp:Transcript_5153/g.9957  ORF Transcript_5153/g.9957 Transcript_5153/m.9957 type:complete len:221 (-) Transcript_5153:697-1359(-)
MSETRLSSTQGSSLRVDGRHEYSTRTSVLHVPTHLLPARMSRHRSSMCVCMLQDDDQLLLSFDVTIIFAFAFARALGNVLLSPTFEGWLAPVAIDPMHMSETLGFAGGCALFWVLGGLLAGGFSYASTADEQSTVGSTLRTWLVAAGLYMLPACALAAAHACIGAACADAALGDAALDAAWGAPVRLGLPLSADVLQGVVGLGLSLVAGRLCYVSYMRPW